MSVLKRINKTIIAVDFDGTLCENKWPLAGEANEHLIKYLRDLQENYGVRIILWTCRCGENLKFAVDWCKEHGLIFNAVNENLPESIEYFGGDSRKIYADMYIDDKNCNVFKLPFKKAKEV